MYLNVLVTVQFIHMVMIHITNNCIVCSCFSTIYTYQNRLLFEGVTCLPLFFISMYSLYCISCSLPVLNKLLFYYQVLSFPFYAHSLQHLQVAARVLWPTIAHILFINTSSTSSMANYRPYFVHKH